MSTYAGAASDRLLADWNAWLTHPDNDYALDAATLGVRGWDLWKNDPMARAVVLTEILGTHGSSGLRLHSTYRDDDNDDTSIHENLVRNQIDALSNSTWHQRGFDASGLLTRYQLETAIDTCAKIGGDAYGVRVWNPTRRNANLATCWRLVRGEFVTNRGYAPDTDASYRGIQFDANGQPAALTIQRTRRTGSTITVPEWDDVPWYGTDGAPNVIMRVGDRTPGAIRGISILAPMLTAMRHLAATNEAYVVGKRVQASHPIAKKVADPKATMEADRKNARNGKGPGIKPLTMLYAAHGDDIIFPNWSFNGQDMKDFLEGQYRLICAARGLPWEFVLAQLTNANLAASRAALLQFYNVMAVRQNEHIAECTSVIDESLIREGIARERISANVTTRDRLIAGSHRRPPRAMPDPLKEVMAAKEWIKLGASHTSAFADSRGQYFDEEVRQEAIDQQFAKSQGVCIAPDAVATDPATDDDSTKTDDTTKQPAKSA